MTQQLSNQVFMTASEHGNAILRLAALLDEEAQGKPIDPNSAIILAEAVISLVPEMVTPMNHLMHRMRASHQGQD